MSSSSSKVWAWRRYPTPTGNPTKCYRRTLGPRYVPPAELVYTVGVPVHHHQQAVLDQLRQRHLAPLEALPLARVQTITWWTSVPLGPPPGATIAKLRAITDLINDILSGSAVPQAHSADFINLTQKLSHCPIANGRPLRFPAMVWKLTAALLKDHYQSRLVGSGILPPHQFGMPPHCASCGAPPRPPQCVVGPLEAAPRGVGPVG